MFSKEYVVTAIFEYFNQACQCYWLICSAVGYASDACHDRYEGQVNECVTRGLKLIAHAQKGIILIVAHLLFLLYTFSTFYHCLRECIVPSYVEDVPSYPFNTPPNHTCRDSNLRH